MQTRWRRLGWVLVVPLAIWSAGALLWRAWPQPQAAIYRVYRDQGRQRTLDQLSGYDRIQSDRFELFYKEQDHNVTDLVLQTAEQLYDEVVAQVGYAPPGRVPLILYPTRQELRAAFGWGSGQSALGVYWKGTIRLLSPNVWISENDPRKQHRAFKKLNPIAHELTHYLLDHLTDGNYPRWFTEGLAQRVERQLTGFLWIERQSTLRQPLYSLVDLADRFDTLSNQPLAYRQSYLLVEYLVAEYGEAKLAGLIRLLGEGVPFERAVVRLYGRTMEELYQSWTGWLERNIDRLETER